MRLLKLSFLFTLTLFIITARAQTISTQTGVISYTEAGHGEALILIHAFPMDERIWREQLTGLKNYFHVIAIDLWGFGHSAVTDGHTITMVDYADEIKQLMDYLQLSTAIIAGESMGGYVALAFLQKYPESVIGLVLSNTQCIADTPEIREKRMALAEEILSVGTKRLIKRFSQIVFSNSANEEMREDVDKILEDQSPAGIASALRGMAARQDTSAALIETDYPILIITSDHDEVIPSEQSENMFKLARNSRLVKIKNAGHLCNLEQSSTWNHAVIRAFYQGNSN